MEKIYIRSTSKEVIAKGTSATSVADIYAYDSNTTDESKKLGSIFVIGHAEHPTDDVNYMPSLVAAMAKREFYSNTDATPREAFTNTLKKVNEIVEDFFKSKDLKVNIGVFAVSGENIYISKLGKFKIFLARDNKMVDILNNVDLFEKEHIDNEKEFSNIISGKIKLGDRLLALHPSTGITSRERYIKSYFLNLPHDEFVSKIETIKSSNDKFSCALLCVDINQFKETTEIPDIQPQELVEKQVILAKTTKGAKKATVAKEDTRIETTEAKVNLAVSQPNLDLTEEEFSTPQELPQIIPSEFSQGRRRSRISFAWSRIKPVNLNQKNKMILLGVIAVAVIGVTFAAKSFLILSPEERELRSAFENAENNLKLAKTKISQDNASEARNLLTGSLLQIYTVGQKSDEQSQIEKDILETLDNIDQAQEASLGLAYTLPDSLGSAKMIGADNSSAVIYSSDKDQKYYLSKVDSVSVSDNVEIKTTNASQLSGSSLVDLAGRQLTTLQDKQAKTAIFETSGTLAGGYLYQGNLYALSADNIYKVTDATATSNKTTTWLKEGGIPTGAKLIAVDGNIFVMTDSGLLATYYKGKKIKEINVPITIDSESSLLTTEDSRNLYLVKKSLNRVYLLDKTLGTIVKTIKIPSTEGIVDVSLSPDETLYVLTKDNKVWRLNK